MRDSQPAAGSVEERRFAYFMVRLQRPAPGGAAALAGVVERLGTGEKRSFASAAELSALLDLWSAAADPRGAYEPPTTGEER